MSHPRCGQCSQAPALGLAALPFWMANDARSRRFKSSEVQLQFFSNEVWDSMFYFRKPCRVSRVILEGFGNFICYSESCWNPKKTGIHVAACKPSQVCSLVLCRKALCWKVLLTLYLCLLLCQFYMMLTYIKLEHIFSLCKWMHSHWVRVELGQCVQVQKTDSSLRKDSGIKFQLILIFVLKMGTSLI